MCQGWGQAVRPAVLLWVVQPRTQFMCYKSNPCKADAAGRWPGSPPLCRRPVGVEALKLPRGFGHSGQLHLLILPVQDAVVLHCSLGGSQVFIAALVPCRAREGRPMGTERYSSTTALAQEWGRDDMAEPHMCYNCHASCRQPAGSTLCRWHLPLLGALTAHGMDLPVGTCCSPSGALLQHAVHLTLLGTTKMKEERAEHTPACSSRGPFHGTPKAHYDKFLYCITASNPLLPCLLIHSSLMRSKSHQISSVRRKDSEGQPTSCAMDQKQV